MNPQPETTPDSRWQYRDMWFGLPTPVAWVWRWTDTFDAQMKLDIRSETRDSGNMGLVWGKARSDVAVPVKPLHALWWFAENWVSMAKSLAEPELQASLPDKIFDLREAFAAHSAAPVNLRIEGHSIIIASGDRQACFGPHKGWGSQIPLISLAGLANHIAEHSASINDFEAAITAWKMALSKVEVFPEVPDFDDEAITVEQRVDRALAEASFFCRKLGLDTQQCVRASVWCYLQRAKFVLGLRPEPSRAEDNTPFLSTHLTLPSLEEMQAALTPELIAAYPGGAENHTWSECLLEAITITVVDLYQFLYYNRRRFEELQQSHGH